MPRILGSTAHLAPLVLKELGIDYNTPEAAAVFPPLPDPFYATEQRIDSLQSVDAIKKFQDDVNDNLASSKKPFAAPYPQIVTD
ncbi:uncharacterized protein L199_004995 [Kwoniella botswanensis]|uniref:uncharacterized protein n=1 Tax=Kwoniella botswanensis TaxID=1268659 RepID=UPI00315D6DF4